MRNFKLNTSCRRIKFLLLTLSFCWFFTGEADGQNRYVIQVASSKTPINLYNFSEKNKLSDSIFVDTTNQGYYYYVGNFETYEIATKYANKIEKESKLNELVIREFNGTLLVSDKLLEQENDGGFLESWYLLLLLRDDEERIQLKKNWLEYGQQNFSPAFQSIYVTALDTVFQYRLILVFSILILVFITNIIIVLAVINYTSMYKNKRDRYIKLYRGLYEEVLLSYLFGELEWEKVLIKLKKMDKPLNRKILVSILFNYQENLRGEMDKQILEIFKRLKLDEDSKAAVNASVFYKKVQGIRALTNMCPESALDVVKDYLNHPHDAVRAEAQSSFIILNKENPFEFFSTLTSPFSRWTQLSVFFLFRLNKFPNLSFVDYLDSDHPDIRNFCLRMIIFFQQLENTAVILEMLNSDMELTRFLSIKAVNELRIYEGKTFIKNSFLEETGKNRLEIIKAFKNIGTEEDFSFLEKRYQLGSVTEKIEACRSLYYMNDAGREKLTELKQVHPELEFYIEHVKDPRN